MGKRNENIITVIDLGSAKTVVLAVETTEAGLRYRGHGIAPSAGTRRGVIVDLQSAGKSVAEAVARAGKGRADCMVVRNIPKSGKTPEDLLAYCHLSEADILAKAKAMVG